MEAPGTRLGPYELSAVIGEGGMGEVYRARDTRLDRTVAVKILRTEYSHRFEREGRAISALNHARGFVAHFLTRRIENSLPPAKVT